MKLTLTLITVLFLLTTAASDAVERQSEKPNFIFILVDDMQFYEWPNYRFMYNLKTDLGETKNVAKSNSEEAGKIHDLMMERLKAVGGYFPKPNPKADPNAKRYDPNNLADKGLAGDLDKD